jgi:outer membrane protein OmpA-like peptidoglycan-associated protein
MKKILPLCLMLTALAFALNAQDSKKAATKNVPDQFQPGWYMGLYTGFNAFLGEYNTPFQSPNNFTIARNVSPMATFALGYDFNPIIGLRGEFGWTRYKWADYAHNNFQYPFWGANLTGDLMVNLSNWWAGYKSTRVFDVQAYAGLGVGYRTDADYNRLSDLVTPIFRLGLQGNFHISKQFDFNIDLSNSMLSDKTNGLKTNLFFDDDIALQVGFTYHFKSTVKPKPIPVPEPIVKIQEVVRHDTVYVKVQPTAVTKTISKEFAKDVFFTINQTKVKDFNQKATIAEAADFLKAYPASKLNIDGYADKNTGTKAVNLKLSKARAQAVADYLVKEYGIDANRLIVTGHGIVPQIYKTNNQNRVTTLKATAEVTETTYR